MKKTLATLVLFSALTVAPASAMSLTAAQAKSYNATLHQNPNDNPNWLFFSMFGFNLMSIFGMI